MTSIIAIGVLSGYVGLNVGMVKLVENAQPCHDCKQSWKSAKLSKYYRKGCKLYLCEECLNTRNHKRSS